ncbi:YhcN/YlaJ family sporulation lipoprotein [Paenibacillus macerans]|uniref:YhcN/YlaJ family sporulation lipoprotein n=1 Tax=Paenibacillus macerans TaxID=44252 RepID=UPI00203A41FB|nr:YhcN/YlaJ family sporulation lipoprotein [Paenibacillus macerans]MCM3700440.1 YhcN/YlaJ family sporulation lipoprotein [Paenibacillus macerans]
MPGAKSKIVNLSLSAALLAGMIGVAGCGDGTAKNNVRTQSVRNNVNRNYDVNSLSDGNRLFSRSAGNGQDQRIRSLRYSPALSNKVAQLGDVQTAHVVVTDRDAYVAVTLHGNNAVRGNTAGRTTTYGMRSTGIGAGTTNAGGPYGAGYGTRGAGNNGLARGLTGPNATGGLFGTRNNNWFGMGTNPAGTGTAGTTGYGTTPGYGTTGTTGTTGYGTTGTVPGTMYNGTGNMGMSSLNRGGGTTTIYGTGPRTGVGTFNGVGTGRYNVNGTVTDNVPQDVKDRIAHVVKQTAPHIRNVYVSGNPDFVTNMGNYATQSRGGGTLNNFIGDFQTMINRIFPGRAGTMTGPNGYTPTGPNTGAGTMGTRGGFRTGTNGGFSGGTTR